MSVGRSSADSLLRIGYYGLNRRKSSVRPLSYYKISTLQDAHPPPLYGADPWTPLSTYAAALRVFKRKFRRKIFGPVRVGDDFIIRSISELYELLNDKDVVHRVNIK